ncbi:hypothetical protein NC99_17970 [Sunxiuqinia dokdonensis]|uniref:Uncharacterized protein n=1 Tax=Sunxiuqinia dokdonensis TaxID=1409788 RepID=A0A0L8VAK5_9BACT|nr:hypothetical protein NC99_17970 [Sunxiuqinia dokdonensis]
MKTLCSKYELVCRKNPIHIYFFNYRYYKGHCFIKIHS